MKRDVILLLVLFAIAIAIVNPVGNFPLDDDWDFALATWQYVRSGHFAFTPFTATSLYAQVLWGGLWTKIFGASFTVLRCSTLFLAALTLILFCALLERLPLTRSERFVAAAALLFHPIFFWSSFTYMTHIPFVFCTVAAVYCFMRGSPALGSVAVIASFFIRQTGVVTAIPAMIVAKDRKSRWIAALPLAVFAVSSPLLQHGEFAFHFKPAEAPLHVAVYVFDHFSAAALFTLPLLVPALGAIRNRGLLIGVIALFLARAALFVGFANPVWNPFLTSTHLFGNIFINLGLGPPTLYDTAQLGFPYPLHLGYAFRVVMTLLSAVAGGALVTLLIEKRSREIGYLLVLCASGVLAASQLWFDRYTIDATWALCFVLPMWTSVGTGFSPSRRTDGLKPVATLLLVVFAAFDMFAVRDYLQWNRDRGQAWSALIASRVPAQQINGGIELNAMARDAFVRPRPDWVVRNDYILAFHPLSGYDVIQRYGRVYVLRRRFDTKFPPITTSWR